MKEKILAQLVQKYAGVSKKFLGLWAERLTTKVTEENQIEGAVNELDNLPISITDLAAEWQKEGDARVNTAKQEWVKNPPKPDNPKPDPKPEPKPEPPKDDTPEWAKALIEQNRALSEKVAGIEKEKTQGTIKQQLSEKLKDLPANYWSKRALPDAEDKIEAFVSEVQDDYKTDFLDKGLITQPASGGSNKSNGKATKEEVDSIVSKIMPK